MSLVVTFPRAATGAPGFDNEAWGTTRMRAKNFRKRAITADDDMTAARPYVARLLKYEEILAGSRMRAYEQVGEAIDEGASWVRRLLSGSERVTVRRCTWLNIAAAYTTLCERIEAAAEHERRLEALLRSETDAALESNSGLVARLARPHRDGAAS